MSRALVAWRSITQSRLSALAVMVFVVAVLGGGYLVMVHGYRVLFQWHDSRFELAPAR